MHYLANSKAPLLGARDFSLIAIAEEICRIPAKEARAIGYMPRDVVIATMPHSKPETNEFRRKGAGLSRRWCWVRNSLIGLLRGRYLLIYGP